MIDLTGQSAVQLEYDSDATTGVTTVMFKDGSGAVLGQMKTETVKLRAYLLALNVTAAELFPDMTPNLQRGRTSFDKNKGVAKTVF